MSPCAFGPCQPGRTIFPNSTTFLDGAGSATFNGTTIGVWWFGRDSVLSFTGPGVVIPESNDARVLLTSPFVMTGSVVVRPLEGPDRPVIFTTTINGSGIATMRLEFFPQFGGYVYSGVQYDFQPTAVPEPTTIVLLTTGAAGMFLGRYRRRKLRQKSNVTPTE